MSVADVVTTSAIEGETLAPASVRSSVSLRTSYRFNWTQHSGGA